MNDHIPYLSLTEVVEDYCISNFNDRQKYFLNYLVHARWIWKKLLWSTVFQIVSKQVCVKSCKNTGLPYIDVPRDLLRFVNLSREGRDKRLIPFVIDDSINEFVPSNANMCACCGESKDLTDLVIKTVPVTKPIILNGTTYFAKEWREIDGHGNMVVINDRPGFTDSGKRDVTTYRTSERICSFDVNDKCGCLKNTDANRNLVRDYCGVLSMPTRMGLWSGNGWAKIKFKDGRIYFSPSGTIPEYLILTYQTNGECGESEMMVPEYAVEAVTFGIHWRAGALAPVSVVGDHDKSSRESQWLKAQFRLEEFLNPIRMDEFINSQMSIPKWGHGIADQNSYSDRDMAALSGPKLASLTEVSEVLQQQLAQMKCCDTGSSGGGGTFDPALCSFMHQQAIAASTWTIMHSLAFHPNVTTTDDSGNVMYGDVSYPDAHTIVIVFSSAVTGFAYLS